MNFNVDEYACAACEKRAALEDLQLCDCSMVAYCSDECRTDDKEEHTEHCQNQATFLKKAEEACESCENGMDVDDSSDVDMDADCSSPPMSIESVGDLTSPIFDYVYHLINFRSRLATEEKLKWEVVLRSMGERNSEKIAMDMYALGKHYECYKFIRCIWNNDRNYGQLQANMIINILDDDDYVLNFDEFDRDTIILPFLVFLLKLDMLIHLWALEDVQPPDRSSSMTKSEIVRTHPTIQQADGAKLGDLRQTLAKQLAALALALDEVNPFVWKYMLPFQTTDISVDCDDVQALKSEAEELKDNLDKAINSTKPRDDFFSMFHAAITSDPSSSRMITLGEEELAAVHSFEFLNALQ
ncbi:hypothetical protein KEM56_000006 [Ascosphaera pollenicola]|nr:hypothetical protein KEM56_000006 [Ascosphaera pollenicola]